MIGASLSEPFVCGFACMLDAYRLLCVSHSILSQNITIFQFIICIHHVHEFFNMFCHVCVTIMFIDLIIGVHLWSVV